MKLARKIVLALVLLVFAVIAGLQTIQVRRELARSELDMQHDHRLLGHTLGGSFVRAWQMEGQEAALTLLSDANLFQEQVRVRWLWLNSREGNTLPAEQWEALLEGQDTSFTDQSR